LVYSSNRKTLKLVCISICVLQSFTLVNIHSLQNSSESISKSHADVVLNLKAMCLMQSYCKADDIKTCQFLVSYGLLQQISALCTLSM